jgi:hypothetical protein
MSAILKLWARVWMRARETKSNWTEVEGSADYLVFRDQSLSDIYRIMSDTMSFFSYTDDDHQDDVQQMAEFELANQFVCVGDTRGNESWHQDGRQRPLQSGDIGRGESRKA